MVTASETHMESSEQTNKMILGVLVIWHRNLKILWLTSVVPVRKNYYFV